MASQKELFVKMEKDFKVNSPIFLNTSSGWFDNKLVYAKDLKVNSIGRYRLDIENSDKGIQELWFDCEFTGYDEKGNKLDVITKDIVKKRFLKLRDAIKNLIQPLIFYFDDPEKIYVRASGSGFHVFMFVEGFKNREHWEKVNKFLIKKSNMENTKGKNKLIFGIDIDSVWSSKRKLRETYSSNKDKVKAGKVDYANYCNCFTLTEFLDLDEYPFAVTLNEVRAPSRYESIKLPRSLMNVKKLELEQYRPKLQPIKLVKNNVEKGNLPEEYISDIDPKIEKQILSCEALRLILHEPESRHWQARHFLVKNMKYIWNLDFNQIMTFLHEHNKWSDYSPDVCARYLIRHFTEGTAETKVKKPIKISTLKKYGYCSGKCEKCVYY